MGGCHRPGCGISGSHWTESPNLAPTANQRSGSKASMAAVSPGRRDTVPVLAGIRATNGRYPVREFFGGTAGYPRFLGKPNPVCKWSPTPGQPPIPEKFEATIE